jgi:flagellar hook-associated protein FlgK
MQQINQYHFQGVGSDGAFTRLTGWTNTSEDLADISNVTSGSIFIRVTNTSTGVTTRTEIAIDANNDSLSDIATAISAITGVTASVNSSNQLTILADANYEFDFLPAVGSSPTASTLTGSPPTISLSGIYTGTANDTFTFTVSGSGAIGNGTLQLIVTDGNGDAITTLNVGSGYAAGDKISIGDTGVKISLGIGDLNDDETFEVDVFSNTDTSGVLAAVGINTFFSGSGATDMAVCSDIYDNPRRVATALGPDMTDNSNAVRMADVRNHVVTDLNSLTCGEFYRQLITDIGQQLSVKQIRQENIDAILQDLSSRQNDASGVDINDEAAQLLIFEQMFQAIAKYMNTVHSSIAELMELI